MYMYGTCIYMYVDVYSAGKLVGETKYLGYYERETQWDEQHITRVKVYTYEYTKS